MCINICITNCLSNAKSMSLCEHNLIISTNCEFKKLYSILNVNIGQY